MSDEFKLAQTPDLMSDTNIHKLCDDERAARLFGGELKHAEAVQAAMNRIERLMRRDENARMFDLHYEYTSFAPFEQRWTCIDLNTYDGAPDSEAPATFIGRGSSEKQARMDLLDQFADYDGRPKPRASRVIHSSPFEPPTYADDDVTFDDDLEDR